MIPVKITEDVYNNLKWEAQKPESLDKAIEGYSVLGAETCLAWYKPDGEKAVDGVTLYLQKPGEEQIKIINIDADFIYLPDERQDSESPITMAVAYV